MVRFLRIRRLAVIDAVEVEFGPGLNILTGETGAGKSMLVEAVGLLLGGRASGELVRSGEEVATIEAIFEDNGEELLIRREITAQGRSRAFVNGELTTAGALKELSARLVELHGQHEHQTLLDPATHLGLLDAFGALDPWLGPVEAAFGELSRATSDLVAARRAAADRDARQDLAAFQLGELERADLRQGEDEELKRVRTVLANAERVTRICEEGYAALYENDGAVLAALGGVWKRVAELAVLDAGVQPYLDARTSIKSQLEDLAEFLRRYADSVEASPERLQQVEERLALLDRLKKKHGPSLADAIAKRERLREELESFATSSELITVLEGKQTLAQRHYLAAAAALSLERKRAASAFARALEHALAELAMEDTRFEVRFTEPLGADQGTARGLDVVEFYLSPNIGEDLRPLSRIVSGGELSRIMLAVKTLLATSRHGFSAAADRRASTAAPGLIFDEVDAGIGGRVADVVGRKLRSLGSAFQVLCITHLPQIAAYADAHFLIEKGVERGRTTTTVTRLDSARQIDEIGRMLGGTTVLSETVRASARELLADRIQNTGKPSKAKGEMKPKGESESRSRAQR